METKEMIDTINWYAVLLKAKSMQYDYTERDDEIIAAIIESLQHYETLMKCKVMTVDGKWRKLDKSGHFTKGT